MSMAWLIGLVGFGLLVLTAIAYGAHRVEMIKIENLKRAQLHRDRYRDLRFIIEVIPSKPIRGELPLLITRNMVLHLEKAMELKGVSGDLKHLHTQARNLHAAVSKGEPLPALQVGGSIGERLKDVQRGIKLLKEFILQQHRGGFLSKNVATAYIKSLHEVNLTAILEGLLQQAKHSLAEGNNSLGLRYFQLAYNEISKSKSSKMYAEQQKEIAEQIKALKADKKVVDDADQEINQQLADSITSKKDDDSFEMKQLN